MPRGTPARHTDPPVVQLLGVRELAAALGLRYHAARALILNKSIPRVHVPSVDGRSVTRRLLVSAADVARLVDEWTDRPATSAR